ncbi:hypothetical protein [Stackebrandtia soli]|uniref:hypothetical protein n=1 Tax=Stackebrandtia soli TaxID=1892856 RepID=UPI0039EB0185
MDGDGLVCSARGCGAAAVWALRWRNPRIHGSDRVKTWLACDEHREHLYEFLTTRGFPCEIERTE